MYLVHRPVITVNKICKTYDVLRSKCTGTISDSKSARTSPYDGTEPVILLRPEDMRARLIHQLPMHSYIDFRDMHVITMNGKKNNKIRQVIN